VQWAKAKTFMIWLFLAVDLILLTVLAVGKLTDSRDSNEKLISILKNNNINIREELLNHDSKKIFAHEFSTLTLSDELASALIKKPIKKDNNAYESEDKTAYMSIASGYFSSIYRKKPVPKPSPLAVSFKNRSSIHMQGFPNSVEKLLATMA